MNEKISYKLLPKAMIIMFFYCFITNLILLIISLIIKKNNWQWYIGLNLGIVVSFINFLSLSFSSKWLLSDISFKQTCANLSFLLRYLIYGLTVWLAIQFKFANIITLVVGLSSITVVPIIYSLSNKNEAKKEKEKNE